jgi:hypothetical protein
MAAAQFAIPSHTGALAYAPTASLYDRLFDGQTNYLASSSTFTPGAVTSISIFFRANLAPAFAMTNGQNILETSTNYNSNNGAFYIGTDNTPELSFNVHTNAGYTVNTISLSGVAAGWHNYLLVLKTNAKGLAFIDGVAQTVTYTSGGSGNFSAYTLYVMSRAGSSLWGSGGLAQLGIWSTALAQADATSLNGGSNPCTYTTSSLLGCWGFSGSSPETDASGYGNSLAVTGTLLEPSTSSSYWSAGGCAPNGSTNIASVLWEAGATGSTTTESQTLTSPTVGHVIVAGARWDKQTVTATVADGEGNTYTPISCSPSFPVNFSTASRVEMWIAPVTSGGSSDVVTVTYSGATTSYSLLDVWELSGVNTTTPTDVCKVFTAAAGGGQAIEFAGIAPTTAYANERIIGAFYSDGNNSSWMAHPCATQVAQEAESYWEYRDVASLWAPYMWVGGGAVSSPPAWAGVVLGLVSQ